MHVIKHLLCLKAIMTQRTSSLCIKLNADSPKTSSLIYPAIMDIRWSQFTILPSTRCLVTYSSLLASIRRSVRGSGFVTLTKNTNNYRTKLKLFELYIQKYFVFIQRLFNYNFYLLKCINVIF